jgi:hypothetical protein
MPELKNPIAEAKRYLQNAKDILRNNTEIEDGAYSDSKYVRIAGDTAWKSCLIALDAAFKVKETKGKRRVSIDDYKNIVSKRNKKLLDSVMQGYEILHLYMGYDGNKRIAIAKDGFELAKTIINKCEEAIS